MARNPFKPTVPASLVECMRSSVERDADEAAADFAARLEQHRRDEVIRQAMARRKRT